MWRRSKKAAEKVEETRSMKPEWEGRVSVGEGCCCCTVRHGRDGEILLDLATCTSLPVNHVSDRVETEARWSGQVVRGRRRQSSQPFGDVRL